MVDNIKYVRWAAKVLKVIMVVNVILDLFGILGALLATGLSAAQGSSGQATLGFTISLTAIIAVFIKAFLTYTAARALELLADVAYHLLVTWQRQHQPQQSTDWQARNLNE